MRKMKDSGIEWMGEIPEDWEVKPIKSLFSFGKGLPITKDNLIENGSSVISYGQIHSKNNIGVQIVDDLKRFVSETYLDTNPNSLVHKGDFIFADTSEDLEGCGNFVYVDKEEILFAGYHTIILFSKQNINNKYLAYLFKTDAWRCQIRGLCSGVKLFSISKKILGQTRIILPMVHEQQRIVDFLDRKCSEIDSVISKTRETIEEYKKLKQSIITEVVNGKVKIENGKVCGKYDTYKDSGIEWIGEIPSEWSVCQIKRFAKLYNGKEIENEVIKSDYAIDVYGSGGVFKYTTNYLYDGEAVLFGRKGSIGKPLIVDGKFWTVDTMYFSTCKQELTMNKFLFYLLKIFPWDVYTTKTALPSIVGSEIFNSFVPVPPLNSQLSLITFLDKKCSEIDALITKKEQLVVELEAYKKSLIYEVVTGKRRV